MSKEPTAYDLKYRPRKFKDVVGQDAVTKVLKNLIAKEEAPHCLLFTGPSGTGKTTLARIFATEMKVDGCNIIEIDAASNSGIDAMKDLMRQAKMRGFGASADKVLIIDECHSISKQAWQSLLKDLEEPPEHLYIILCTTELNKVPAAIKTRASKYSLTDVRRDDLIDRIEYVAEEEGLKIDPKAYGLIAKHAGGSVREALVTLQQVSVCKKLEDVKEILKTADRNPEFFELCRILVNGTPKAENGYKACVKIVRDLDIPNESLRIGVVSYITKCLLGDNVRNQMRLLQTLSCFVGETWIASEKQAPILIALAEVYLEE